MSDRLERRPYGWERRAVIAGTRSHPLIRGLAIVFNERSQDLGGFLEVIKPEAFRRTLSEGIDLRAFFDHDPAKVLGRQSAGTLRVDADQRGVMVEIDPPSSTDPPNLMESIERGDITGMSFSFRVVGGMGPGEEWKQEGGQHVRYVKDMRVFEISIVALPAYQATDVEVALRSRSEFIRGTLDERLAVMERRAAAWR